MISEFKTKILNNSQSVFYEFKKLFVTIISSETVINLQKILLADAFVFPIYL